MVFLVMHLFFAHLFKVLIKIIIPNLYFYLFPVLELIEFRNPCNPSPCGPNSQCRGINGQGVCSCVPGYLGSPPNCRPECIVSSECLLNQACVNQKCIDPCPGTCGFGAICQVVNHSPICSCANQQTGDPFTRCYPIRKIIIIIFYKSF